MKNLFFLFTLFSFAFQVKADDSFFIGDPLVLKNDAYNTVLKQHPDAELWIIQNFSRAEWDEGCSQFGWAYIFIGQVNGAEKDIRIKFDHVKQADGSCQYKARTVLEVEPNQIVGIQRVKPDSVQVGFKAALEAAAYEARWPFEVWWVKLFTPLHPAAKGRTFWSFKGSLSCNKGAEVVLDATTGLLEPAFSYLPNCP